MNYLKIKGEELLQGKIPIAVFPDRDAAFRDMAAAMIEEIEKNNREGRRTLLIVPVGPVGQYPHFVQRVNFERISLRNVTFINMDEYMLDERTMVPEDHPLSFRGFMNREVYGRIDPELVMPESQRIFPEPGNGERINEVIRSHGGVDVCFGGIGINGHVAFNEPLEAGEVLSCEEFAKSSVRVQRISRETKVVNALNDLDGAFYAMPDFAVTVGMKEILESRKVRLYCFRPWHRSVVRRALFDEVTPAFPVTFLQKHGDAKIGITRELYE